MGLNYYSPLVFTLLLGVALRIMTTSDVSAENHPLLIAHRQALSDPRCGTGWQEDMRKNQKNTSRNYIAVAPDTGASDRTIGYITGFYAALLSNRSFVLYSDDDLPRFSLAFDHEGIDWTPTNQTKITEIVNMLRKSHDDERKGSAAGKPLTVHEDGFYLDGRDKNKSFIIDHLEDLESNISINAAMVCNRGSTYKLLQDVSKRPRLQAYNITPALGFYCAFHYLFRPQLEVLKLAYNISRTIVSMQQQKHRIIGIHIRSGDGGMRSGLVQPKALSGNVTWPLWGFETALFKCAAKVEQEHSTNDTLPFYYYLMADSLQVRQEAKAIFGDKIITDLNHMPVHSGIDQNRNARINKFGFVLVFAELLSYSLSDYFIVSQKSGVSIIGSWLNPNHGPQNTYYLKKNARDHSWECRSVDFDEQGSWRNAGI